MNPSPESQPSTPAPGKQGSPWMIAGAIGIVSIFALLFVVPGFVAGIYDRTCSGYLKNGDGPCPELVDIYLYPSSKLEEYFPAAGGFYEWEYEWIAAP